MPVEPYESARRRNYDRPPVVEAVALLHWDEPDPWRITTPGRLYELLREVYPAEPQTRTLLKAGMSSPGDGPAPPGLEFRSGPEQMIFSASEGSRLLIVGRNDLSVHGLQPYEGWDALLGRLEDGFDRLAPHLGKRRAFSQLGLRYINRVEIPSTDLRLEEYFTIGFALPPTFPQSITGFMDRIEVSYPDDPVKLSFTWASTDAPAGSSAFILDFDFQANPSPSVRFNDAVSLLGRMKQLETSAFEGLIQDALRRHFGESS